MFFCFFIINSFLEFTVILEIFLDIPCFLAFIQDPNEDYASYGEVDYPTQRQPDGTSCGLFAMGNILSLVRGQVPLVAGTLNRQELLIERMCKSF